MANPVLNDKAFQRAEQYTQASAGELMSVEGAINKTAFLLLLVVAGATWVWTRYFQAQDPAAVIPYLWVGILGGAGAALATIFVPTWARLTAPLYAAAEGLALGAISAFYETQLHGIVFQAIGLTFGVLAAMLVLYRSGIIKVTDRFRMIVVAATGGIALFYLVTIVLGFFHINVPFLYGGGTGAIILSLVIVGIAALEPGARFRLHQPRRRARRAEVHGVVRRLRVDGHVDLAVPRDPAPARERASSLIHVRRHHKRRAQPARRFLIRGSPPFQSGPPKLHERTKPERRWHMSTKELIEGAVEHLRSSASVKTVYGDPIVVDGKTVIPVAKVAYGFGVGHGSGTHQRKTADGKTPVEGEGEGGGGGVAARPVGVVEISGAETKFVPFGTPKKLMITALVGAGVGIGLGWLLGRKVSKN